MSMIQLSYSKLLGEITEKLGVAPPECIITVIAEGWYLGYVDAAIARSATVIENARCWGSPSADLILAKDDAARAAINRIKSELHLHIIDTNYDDFMLYKSLYDHVTAQHTDLLGKFENLQREYNLLKDCYASAVAERVQYIDEKVKMQCTIDECQLAIGQLRAEKPATTSGHSEAGSAS